MHLALASDGLCQWYGRKTLERRPKVDLICAAYFGPNMPAPLTILLNHPLPTRPRPLRLFPPINPPPTRFIPLFFRPMPLAPYTRLNIPSPSRPLLPLAYGSWATPLRARSAP
ncbi:hypothetical protein QCA50_003482 [Cerrena zonata]|uniref:Uncharacterized protein n=1 Tax=Cerrena zonata TaxID=2478898 RepID=A0AAW0GKM9_9APHY